MNENSYAAENLTNGKATYEKPAVQVYEMEVEGAILQTSEKTEVIDYILDTPLS